LHTMVAVVMITLVQMSKKLEGKKISTKESWNKNPYSVKSYLFTENYFL
jgi:hypothetical protein